MDNTVHIAESVTPNSTTAKKVCLLCINKWKSGRTHRQIPEVPDFISHYANKPSCVPQHKGNILIGEMAPNLVKVAE